MTASRGPRSARWSVPRAKQHGSGMGSRSTPSDRRSYPNLREATPSVHFWRHGHRQLPVGTRLSWGASTGHGRAGDGRRHPPYPRRRHGRPLARSCAYCVAVRLRPSGAICAGSRHVWRAVGRGAVDAGGRPLVGFVVGCRRVAPGWLFPAPLVVATPVARGGLCPDGRETYGDSVGSCLMWAHRGCEGPIGDYVDRWSGGRCRPVRGCP